MDQDINSNENSNTTNNINSNSLFELIQNIQSKLNVEQNQEKNKEENVQEIPQKENSTKTIDSNKNQNSGFDFSALSGILNNFVANNGNSNGENDNSGMFENMNIDPNTILRMQKVIGQMNRKDPRKNLLLSLKPFLRKSRQDKISEYITILNVTSALGIFGDKGSD
jgi:hypothetical protein